MPNFGPQQAEQAWDRTRTWLEQRSEPFCKVPWDEIPWSVQQDLLHPLILRLAHQVHAGRERMVEGLERAATWELWLDQLLDRQPHIQPHIDTVIGRCLAESRPDLDTEAIHEIRHAWREDKIPAQILALLDPVEQLQAAGVVRFSEARATFVHPTLLEVLLERRLRDELSASSTRLDVLVGQAASFLELRGALALWMGRRWREPGDALPEDVDWSAAEDVWAEVLGTALCDLAREVLSGGDAEFLTTTVQRILENRGDAGKRPVYRAVLGALDGMMKMDAGGSVVRADLLSLAERSLRRDGERADGEDGARDTSLWLNTCLIKRGDLLRVRGEADAAIEAYGEAERIARAQAEGLPEAFLGDARTETQALLAPAPLAEQRGFLTTVLAVPTMLLEGTEMDLGGGGTGAARGVAVAAERRGDLLVSSGYYQEARAVYEESLDVFKMLLYRSLLAHRLCRDVSRVRAKIGDTWRTEGRLTAAREYYVVACETLDSAIPCDRSKEFPKLLRDRSVLDEKLGTILLAEGKAAEALECFELARAQLEELARSRPGDTKLAHLLAVANVKVGEARLVAGGLNSAASACLVARDIERALLARDPENRDARVRLAACHLKIGDVRVRGGETSRAAEEFLFAIRHLSRLLGGTAHDAPVKQDLATAHNRLGRVYDALGDPENALHAFEVARSIRTDLAFTAASDARSALLGAPAQRARLQADLCRSHAHLGKALARAGLHDAALRAFETAWTECAELAKAEDMYVDWRAGVTDVAHQIAHVVERAADATDASAGKYEAALRTIETHFSSDSRVLMSLAGVREQLAIGLFRKLAPDDAESVCFAAGRRQLRVGIGLHVRAGRLQSKPDEARLLQAESHERAGDCLAERVGDLGVRAKMAAVEEYRHAEEILAAVPGPSRGESEPDQDRTRVMSKTLDVLRIPPTQPLAREIEATGDEMRAAASGSAMVCDGYARLVDREPDRRELRVKQWEALDLFIELQEGLGQQRKALNSALSALDALDGWLRLHPADRDFRLWFSRCLLRVGDLQGSADGSSGRAIERFEESWCQLEALLRENPDDVEVLEQRCLAGRRLAREHENCGNPEAAQVIFANVRSHREVLLQRHSDEPRHRLELFVDLCELAGILGRAGHADRALAAYRDAFAFRQGAVESRSTYEQLVQPVTELTGFVQEVVENADIKTVAETVAAVLDVFAPAEAPWLAQKRGPVDEITGALRRLGGLLTFHGRPEPGWRAIEAGVVLKWLCDNNNKPTRRDHLKLGDRWATIGIEARDRGDDGRARRAFGASVAAYHVFLEKPNPPTTHWMLPLCSSFERLGTQRYEMGDMEEAESAFQSSADILGGEAGRHVDHKAVLSRIRFHEKAADQLVSSDERRAAVLIYKYSLALAGNLASMCSTSAVIAECRKDDVRIRAKLDRLDPDGSPSDSDAASSDDPT